ncbi:hypothetical protein C9374_003584 [Naegleria lovaniensis]|uniref:Uncharacterized protein n=1 Tax=Naegleria lovaniensis TaxID=51637 RepID=A0AA88KYA2_NAELO|nr:uncharacterized protein C9374_003584 [Naegleria lovaniensis]KAG2393820.1 hypothetical protein C9374_003584 [Naegleria lovaniensis]
MIDTCTPEPYYWLRKEDRHALSLEFKMYIYQQLFLKDGEVTDRDEEVVKSIFQMLLQLPDDYYRAHLNYSRRLPLQGIFQDSLNARFYHNTALTKDQAFGKIVRQVWTRIEFLLDAVRYNYVEELRFNRTPLSQDANFILECVKLSPSVFRDPCIALDPRKMNYENISEHVKRWGIITTDFMDGVFKFFGRDFFNNKFKREVLMLLRTWNHQRLEFEYLGCHIPASRLLKAPIKLLELECDEDVSYPVKSRLDAYTKWKKYLFGNASWKIFVNPDSYESSDDEAGYYDDDAFCHDEYDDDDIGLDDYDEEDDNFSEESTMLKCKDTDTTIIFLKKN